MIFKDDWEKVKTRLDAWWEQEIVDRVPIQVIAPMKEGGRGEYPINLTELIQDPQAYIEKMEQGYTSTFYGGEAFPYFLVFIGPVMLSAFMDCPLTIQEETSWQKPVIANWEESIWLRFDRENKWWIFVKELTAMAAKAAEGKFHVAMTDLGGILDNIANLRGMENLCGDLVENPQAVREARKQIMQFWFQVYEELNGIIHKHLEGSSTWLRTWSSERSSVVQCDFSALISPEMFAKFVLPDIESQVRWLDHSVYHLDGPGAVKHLDYLLEIQELDAIQWAPGEGSKPIREWLPLLKKIQRKGKSLHIEVEKEDVQFFISELSPEGLMIQTRCDSPDEAKEIIKAVDKLMGKNLRK